MFLILLCFLNGEKLVYDGYFGPWKVGVAVMEFIPEDSTGEIVSTQRTTGFFKRVFYVDDKETSIVRLEDLTSIRFKKRIREGKYSADIEITYREDSIIYSDGRRFYAGRRYYDILSAIYRAREMDFNVGDTLKLPVHTGGKPKVMFIPVVDTVKVSVPYGVFSAYVLSPVVKGEKVFGSEGDLKIYLSKDTLKIPVLIETKLFFGKLLFRLKERHPIEEKD